MGNGEGYYEARQHLNLSQAAYDVVTLDAYAFLAKPSFAGMLNRIFELYREDAAAAVGPACDRYEKELKNELSGLPESPEKAAVIRALREAQRRRLIETARSCPRECPFKFQLNRENYAFISDWRDTEGAYGGVPGRFIKAVIEEYARKPMAEREAVIFQDLISTVRHSAETQKALVITLRDGGRYEVKPYCVCTDRGRNYHYLAGYCKSTGAPEAREHPASFRLTNIVSYKKTSRSGRLTAEQKKEIEGKIHTAGVQFLLQASETVQIRLTRRGKSMYESQAHLRPGFDNRREEADGTWLYTFSCTPIQARFYFFKFGAEAEVLSPPELRDSFAERYKAALSVYQTDGAAE